MRLRELYLGTVSKLDQGKSSSATSCYTIALKLFISVLAADGENSNGLRLEKKLSLFSSPCLSCGLLRKISLGVLGAFREQEVILKVSAQFSQKKNESHDIATFNLLVLHCEHNGYKRLLLNKLQKQL